MTFFHVLYVSHIFEFADLPAKSWLQIVGHNLSFCDTFCYQIAHGTVGVKIPPAKKEMRPWLICVPFAWPDLYNVHP